MGQISKKRQLYVAAFARDTYIFKPESVAASELEINQHLLVATMRVEQVNKVAPNFLGQAIVGQIETKEGCILCKCVDHVINALHFFSVVREVVRLQVQATERTVLLKYDCDVLRR